MNDSSPLSKQPSSPDEIKPTTQPNAPLKTAIAINPRALWMMVRRSLYRHGLSTTVTVLAVALAGGLVMAVFSIQAQSQKAFTGGEVGFDAVLGARGSSLQLVLNSVFHLETSPGNIPWSLYESTKQNPMVELAVPYAVGDHYRGFRIVGTTVERFTSDENDGDGGLIVQPPGRLFDEHRREAVIGRTVAEQCGLQRGSHFHPSHGLHVGDEHEHDEEYVVVGVLERTNSPNDRVIWIPIEGIFRMGGHVLRGSGEMYHAEAGHDIEAEHKEVSAVMIRFSDPQAGFDLEQMINREGKEATLAFPIAAVMLDLFNKMGWVSRVLELVAYLVVVVSVFAILAALYNTLNERRREFAILRALGARKSTVFSVILLESSVIAGLGATVGFVVYMAILAVSARTIHQQTGVMLDVFSYHPALIWSPLCLLLLGTLAGIIPAFNAYRTDTTANLQPHS